MPFIHLLKNKNEPCLELLHSGRTHMIGTLVKKTVDLVLSLPPSLPLRLIVHL